MTFAALAVMASSGSASATPATTAPWALESGGIGCFDPLSWVWSAPRAERVALSLAEPLTCEIGTAGCDRQAESLVIETDWLGDAAAVCAFKQTQYESAENPLPFDSKSCLHAEVTSLRGLETPAPLRTEPSELLMCGRQDPRCQSLPPLPSGPTLGAALHFVLTVAPPTLVEPEAGPTELPAHLERAREGYRRRLERPPATATRSR